MKVSATRLANQTEAIIERVVQRCESAEIQRHGKTVAHIRRVVGTDRQGLVELAKRVQLTKSGTKELKRAMDAASDVVGNAGSD